MKWPETTAENSNEVLRRLARDSSDVDASKRTFLRLAGTGVAGLAVGGVIAPIGRPGAPEPACSAKSVNAEVQVVHTFLNV